LTQCHNHDHRELRTIKSYRDDSHLFSIIPSNLSSASAFAIAFAIKETKSCFRPVNENAIEKEAIYEA